MAWADGGGPRRHGTNSTIVTLLRRLWSRTAGRV